MSMRGLINFLSYYAGWAACVFGAAGGRLIFGPVVVVSLLGLHLLMSSDPKRELRLIVLCGVLGFATDTALASLGVFSFGDRSPLPWLSPPWMVALWMMFGSTLNASLQWLLGRTWLAAGLGAVAGPISYYYGARLGAIQMPASAAASFVIIGVAWAVAMVALLRLNSATPAAIGVATSDVSAAG